VSYTVHGVAELSGVTIKTLYYYQKIGLLLPEKIGTNGYRYYGEKELLKLQQILILRELDYPLKSIIAAMESEICPADRLNGQKPLLLKRRQQLDDIIQTIDNTVEKLKTGEPLQSEQLFLGVNTKEWDVEV